MKRSLEPNSARDFFYFNIFEHQGPTNDPCKISAKYTESSGEKVNFIGVCIFSAGGHLGFSIRQEFIILRSCKSDHVKFENHGCSCFRE